MPDEGPSDNPLCSIATVNATTLMATFECTEPLNGTYITVTKNDGGKMNICGFSASLGDESPVGKSRVIVATDCNNPVLATIASSIYSSAHGGCSLFSTSTA